MISTTATAIRITGRLTKEVRTAMVDGTPVTNFTVAFANGMRPQMAQAAGRAILAYVESTSYLHLTAWGPESTIAATLTRGQEVSLDVTGMHANGHMYEGRIQAEIRGRASAIIPGADAKHALPVIASLPADGITIA